MPDDSTTDVPTMDPPETGIRVRMYRPGGLGDCFLLAFRAADGSGRYMLIDCGVFTGTPGGSDRMREIAADIAGATGNRLHVLAVTHEHWDHLAGFQYARETFDALNIDDIWVAWTEDPDDAQAQRLRGQRHAALAALTGAASRLKAADDPAAPSVEDVLAFFGEVGGDGLGARTRRGTAAQMDYVNNRIPNPSFREPGEPPVTLPGVEGVRVYVLGPPRNEALLTNSNPSRRDSEVYEERHEATPESAFYTAALATAGMEMTSDDEAVLDLSRPFDASQAIPWEKAAKHPDLGAFFRESYGFGDGKEEGEGAPWRRVDLDWLAAAGSLALKLDSDTNNTSLALAIELVDSGRVLLFPADAQVGNWLSWHHLSWPGEGDAQVTAQDLLRRTVLYKVGHHGSHNATLREKGLEMMDSPELVAMIPVHQGQAEKKHWAMPFEPLFERLTTKTRGRILRADTGLPERPPQLSQEEWDAFLLQAGEDELFVEYTVAG